MFTINGIDWEIIYVNPFSDDLRRSDGSLTVGVTDMLKRSVFLSNRLRGAFLRKVLAHELVHCFIIIVILHIDSPFALCYNQGTFLLIGGGCRSW